MQFCPVGLAPVYQVHRQHIKKLINVPQLPSKLILIYINGQLTFQLTLNIPTYTKAAKIYKKIYSMMVETSDEMLREDIKR